MSIEARKMLVNGDVDRHPTANEAVDTAMVKKLYGIPNERGGTDWLEECPDYMQSASEHPDHALLTRFKEARYGAAKRSLNLVTIDIQSSELKLLLRQIFRSYPGVSVDSDALSFDAPFYPFLHSWATLEAVNEKAPSDEVQALMQVLRADFGDGMRDAQSLARNGNCSFDLLWMLFPLGCPVVGELNYKPHLMLVNAVKYLSGEVIPTLQLELILLDYDGGRYGWRKMPNFVQAFAGSIKISALPVIPLPFYEDATSILGALEQRGVKAAELIGQSPVYRAYEGSTRLHRAYDMEEVEIFMEGRIILDPKIHAQQAPRYCPTTSTKPHSLDCLLTRDSTTKIVRANDDERQSFGLLSVFENLNKHPLLSVGKNRLARITPTDVNDRSPLRHHRWTEALFGIRPESFCRSVLRGYTLTSKSWAEFEVDNTAEIKWNQDAFASLVIPPARKRLLEALVRQQQHNKADADFEDFVQGKGQGLIMLLAGPPGTGKTLTAESIADKLHLPLYAVSASELGDTAKQIEEQFGQVLRLAASWDAVLLLDEADAFLEKRVDSEVARDRNKRVAAFLRILEYYKGILILTTNRTVNFDDAFYSRIHLSLTFKALDMSSRANIWANFLREADISPADMEDFAKVDLNGRQIKNIMKMARLLARDEGKALQAVHVRDVLEVAMEDAAQVINYQ